MCPTQYDRLSQQ